MSVGIAEYAKGVTRAFENSIEEFIPESSQPTLRKCIIESMSSGKHLRPLLCITAFRAFGKETRDAIPAALAVELTHAASLIHDDIIDNDHYRRSKESLHTRIGTNRAIVVGDAMIAMAVGLSANYGAEVVKLMSDYGFRLTNGQFMDMEPIKPENLNEEFYFSKVRQKSASLFMAATHAAAVASGAKHKEAQAMKRFGENLGTAYQIKDDILDLKSAGKGKVPSDLRNACVTLPMIKFCERSPGKRCELDGYLKGEMTLGKAKAAVKIISDSGAFGDCEEKIDELVKGAKSALCEVRDSKFKDYLMMSPEFVLEYLEMSYK